MKTGIVVWGGKPSPQFEKQAAKHKLPVQVCAEICAPPFDKTLYIRQGTEESVPWDLLPAAWNFLIRWDAAVPLWRYGVTAADVGTSGEQERTAKLVRDLRVLLHSYELLFVRDGELGRALIAAFCGELKHSSEPRLAFLRAVYQVKPRLCVLPRTWLAKIFERAQIEARQVASQPARRRGEQLVTVEVAPGRFVKCNPGDETTVLRLYNERKSRREKRRG